MFAEARSRSVCSPQTYLPVTAPSSDCLLCARLLFSLLYCLPLFVCDVLQSFFFLLFFFLILSHFIVLMSPRLSEYKHGDEPQQVHNHRQIFWLYRHSRWIVLLLPEGSAQKQWSLAKKMSTNYRKTNEMSLALFIGLSGVNQKSNDYRCERPQTHFVCLFACFLPSTLLELAHPWTQTSLLPVYQLVTEPGTDRGRAQTQTVYSSQSQSQWHEAACRSKCSE